MFVLLVVALKVPGIFPSLEGLDVKSLIGILERGSIILIHEEPGKPKFISGIVLIDTPFEKVWGVVTDYGRYHEFVPNAKKLTVLKRFPESSTQITEYYLGFKALGFFSVKVIYTLEQHLHKKERIIWGVPAAMGKQVFKEVLYREMYFPVGQKTVMIYTAYADLASFGLLAKLVYKWFPELQTPTLVAVSTLFPEAVKERLEGRKVIIEPKEVVPGKVEVPPRMEDISPLLPLLKRFGKVIISYYPDENKIRFFSGLFFTQAPKDTARRVVTNFEQYPEFFKMVKKAKAREVQNGYSVDLKIAYKVIFPITIKETLNYTWTDDRSRLYFELDKNKKHDIEGEWGAWDFWPVDGGTVVSYTSFSDLRSSSFFFRILMDNIEGFGMGMRVATMCVVTEAFSSRLSEP